jgi:hypothetical protein
VPEADTSGLTVSEFMELLSALKCSSIRHTNVAFKLLQAELSVIC